MAKITTQIQDIDSSILTQVPAVVLLPKIAAPFTTVTKRAQCTDFSKDLLPRLGIDRVMTQAIQEVPGESGPNGERVFKPINDVHDAVRFVGGWGSFNDSVGQYNQTPSSDSTSFVEITFYGTALNLLVGFNTTADRSVNVVVDGGSNTLVAFTGTTGSSVLNTRNYSLNIPFTVASGLTLGVHTIKIRGNGTSAQLITGYEVLNTNTTLQYTPGTSYAGGRRLYTPSLTTAAYNSGFESGSLGTRGGSVLVYQKADGTIAKAVNPTNASAAYLTSADHTNETVSRVYNPREFAAGRSDDYSSMVVNGSQNLAFTLDDGTTTLVSSGAYFNSVHTGYLGNNTVGSFFTLTFVGTGLDVTHFPYSTTGTNTWSVTVDGTLQGSYDVTSASGTIKVYKICSGLPYGTHTVKITTTTNPAGAHLFTNFTTYAPSLPALPSGAVALGSYCVMADYVNDSASPPTVNTVSQGVLRKLPTREMIYSGTWLMDAIAPTVSSGGFQTYTNSATSDYLEYTFFGTGFNFRTQGTGGGALSWTFSLNGPANTNWSAYTSSISAGGTATWNSSTGLLSVPTSAPKASLFVSGLPLGRHVVRIAKTSGAFAGYVDCFDIITPIHTVAFNGPGVIQNTLSLGSECINDLRKFSEQQVLPVKNWAQAVGVAVSPTTTSTAFVPMPDMSTTIKTSGNPIEIRYSANVYSSLASNNLIGLIYVDGIAVGKTKNIAAPAVNYQVEISDSLVVQVAAGFHKIDLYWTTNSGTMTGLTDFRNLTVREI